MSKSTLSSIEAAPPTDTAEFQRREWAVQRAGWVVLWLIVLSAGAGLFGKGPVAHAHATGADGWRVDYERFARSRTPTRLAITIPAVQRGDTAKLWLDRQYADGVDIQQVTPEPLSVAVEPDRLVYRFLTGSGSGPVKIVFDLEPQKSGRIGGRAGAAGSAGIEFSQLVYP